MEKNIAALDALDATVSQITMDGDTMWNLMCAILVYSMQLGFAFLEMGNIGTGHYGSVLNKNVTDLAVAALAWYAIGWGLTGFGSEGDNPWFAIPDKLGNPAAADYGMWFFQLSFAATAATIVSGAMAGRTKMLGYAIHSLIVTGFIYPVIVHWAWDSEGFLYDIGYLDFAGSGVVHMVGGILALIGAIAVGPRKDFLNQNEIALFNPLKHGLVGGGSLILLFGWFGFNAGSTGSFHESMQVAAHCVITTILGASAGFITHTVITVFESGAYDSKYIDEAVGGGMLAGLVSVTAGTDRLAPEWAIIAGAIGAIISYFTNKAIKNGGIDDPVGAVGVHGAAGFWGVLILAIAPGYADNKYDWSLNFKSQLVGLLLITVWTTITGCILFGVLKYTVGLRSEEEEFDVPDVPDKDKNAIQVMMADMYEVLASWKMSDKKPPHKATNPAVDLLKVNPDFFDRIGVTSSVASSDISSAVFNFGQRGARKRKTVSNKPEGADSEKKEKDSEKKEKEKIDVSID